MSLVSISPCLNLDLESIIGVRTVCEPAIAAHITNSFRVVTYIYLRGSDPVDFLWGDYDGPPTDEAISECHALVMRKVEEAINAKWLATAKS